MSFFLLFLYIRNFRKPIISMNVKINMTQLGYIGEVILPNYRIMWGKKSKLFTFSVQKVNGVPGKPARPFLR
ncbi:hypothetical protein HMPREF9413_4253 [Paenibacillus sp. HGF7]|nr:hypothetical protein HMPREF9413_4253 [Paenibacillus sp. HGF7]